MHPIDESHPYCAGPRPSRRALFRHGFTAAVALAAVPGLLTACASAPPPTAPATAAPKVEPKPAAKTEPVAGGTLTIAVGNEPQSLDYNFAQDIGALDVVNNIFSHLVRTNLQTGEPQPDAAIAWKSLDPLTWQFTLRDGIRFHNGEPLDAASVKTTFDLSVIGEKVPQTSIIKGTLAKLKSIEAPDRLTVVFKTSDPLATFPTLLYRVKLYPAKYYAEQGNDGFRQRPVGSGPFTLSSWQRGSALTIERFDGYFGEKAKLDKVVFKPAAEKSTRLAALQAGEVQIAADLDPDDIPVLTSKGFQVVSGPQAASWMLHMRPAPTSPTNDVRVRKAINHAIDRDTLVKQILGGTTRRLDSLVGPGIFGYNPDIKGYAYDPALTKSLLKEAGFENGFEIDFDSQAAGATKVKEVAQYLVGELQKVGIRAKLTFLESSQLTPKWVSGTIAPLSLWGLFFFPDMDSMRQLTRALLGSPKWYYSSPELDRLVNEAAGTFDVDQRRKMVLQANQMFFDLAPAAFLYQGIGLHGAAKNVQGFRVTPDTINHFEAVSLG